MAHGSEIKDELEHFAAETLGEAIATAGEHALHGATGGTAGLIAHAAKWIGQKTIRALDDKLGVVESIGEHYFKHDELTEAARKAFRSFAVSVRPSFDRLETLGVDTAPIRHRFGMRFWGKLSTMIEESTIREFIGAELAGKRQFEVVLDEFASTVALTKNDFPPPSEIRLGALRTYKREIAAAIFETCRRLRADHPKEARLILRDLATADFDVASELVNRCVRSANDAMDRMRQRLENQGMLGGPVRAAANIVEGLREFRLAVADLREVARGLPGKADVSGAIPQLRQRFRHSLAPHLSGLDLDQRSALAKALLPQVRNLDAGLADELEVTLREPAPARPLVPAPQDAPEVKTPTWQAAFAAAKRSQQRVLNAVGLAAGKGDVTSQELLAGHLDVFDRALDAMKLRMAEASLPAGRADDLIGAMREKVQESIGEQVATLRGAGRDRDASRLLRTVARAGETWRVAVTRDASTAQAVQAATRREETSEMTQAEIEASSHTLTLAFV